ncbi:DNA repair protein RadA [Oscillospiraceae bacterium HV4-5-C5C]|nr:DNA repair protein RadA [Oscillospiraceae bacterium HV4-5-C5C]
MAKSKTVFYCSECGHESSGWLGRCPNCGAWNSFVEQRRQPASGSGNAIQAGVASGWLSGLLEDAGMTARTAGSRDGAAGQGRENSLALLDLDGVAASEQGRVSSGLEELDRVLGQGFVPGSLVLVGGNPGIGKSTLLLQVAARSQFARPVLYVNGEESPQQVKLRAERLGIKGSGIKLMPEIVFERIAEAVIKVRPELCIVDSIQTVYSESLSSAPGTVSQVRDVTAGLLRLAKALNTTIVLVGHVTKDGSLAGPRVLEHMVDTVLYFEGEANSSLRVLRSAKNRFGATNELGIFEMTQEGLQGVKNASAAFLTGRPEHVPGSAVTCTIEGTRPLLVEVQALLNPSAYPTSQRQAQGVDRNRLNLLLAVLENRLQLSVGAMDAFLNVVGGVRVDDPAADLAIAAAIASSFRDRAVRDNTLLCGEVGLTGELRPVSFPLERIMEAGRMGFTTCLLPGSDKKNLERQSRGKDTGDWPEILYVDTLGEALDVLLEDRAGSPGQTAGGRKHG